MGPWHKAGRVASPAELALIRLLVVHGATLRTRWPKVAISRSDGPFATTIGALLDFLESDRPLFAGPCLHCGGPIFPITIFSTAESGGLSVACSACGKSQYRVVEGSLGGRLVEVMEDHAAYRDGVIRAQQFGGDGRIWHLPVPGPALFAVAGEIDELSRFGLDGVRAWIRSQGDETRGDAAEGGAATPVSDERLAVPVQMPEKYLRFRRPVEEMEAAAGPAPEEPTAATTVAPGGAVVEDELVGWLSRIPKPVLAVVLFALTRQVVGLVRRATGW